MLDIGWQELVIVMVVTIVIIGPKDFPRVIRGFHKVYKNIKHYISEGQKTVQNIIQEAELTSIKTSIKQQIADTVEPIQSIIDAVEPIQSIGDDDYSIQDDTELLNAKVKKHQKSIKLNKKIQKTKVNEKKSKSSEPNIKKTQKS